MDKRLKIALGLFGVSFVIGVYKVVGEFEGRISHLEEVVEILTQYIDADFQQEIDEEFIEIAENLKEEGLGE